MIAFVLAATLSGVVRLGDSPFNLPVALRLTAHPGGAVLRAVNDEHGRYVFPNLAPGSYVLEGESRDAAVFVAPVPVCILNGDLTRDLLLDSDVPFGTCCTFWPGEPPKDMKWTGTVVDEANRAVSGAVVSVTLTAKHYDAVTDEQGRFALWLPREQTWVPFVVTAAGFFEGHARGQCYRPLTIRVEPVCHPERQRGT